MSEGNYTCPHCGAHFSLLIEYGIHVASCTFRPKK